VPDLSTEIADLFKLREQQLKNKIWYLHNNGIL
jgi:hypothetical protein